MVTVFTSLSINILLNNFWGIIGVTVVTFLVIGILFSFMFSISEKKMKDARDAINKKVDDYMKTH